MIQEAFYSTLKLLQQIKSFKRWASISQAFRFSINYAPTAFASLSVKICAFQVHSRFYCHPYWLACFFFFNFKGHTLTHWFLLDPTHPQPSASSRKKYKNVLKNLKRPGEKMRSSESSVRRRPCFPAAATTPRGPASPGVGGEGEGPGCPPFALLAEMEGSLFGDPLGDVHLGPQAPHAHVGRVGRDGHAALAAEAGTQGGKVSQKQQLRSRRGPLREPTGETEGRRRLFNLNFLFKEKRWPRRAIIPPPPPPPGFLHPLTATGHPEAETRPTDRRRHPRSPPTAYMLPWVGAGGPVRYSMAAAAHAKPGSGRERKGRRRRRRKRRAAIPREAGRPQDGGCRSRPGSGPRVTLVVSESFKRQFIFIFYFFF